MSSGEKSSNFTQYSSNQPPGLDTSDSELSRKAEELEKDLATSAKSTNRYAD
ncbi:MAG: hypothetical protein EXX96DRAFT_616676 [Benjaminiella poitrasii]|nr:MAG: hypothetical protein EXX96DRAFT_616676 [Benjaminiella poitrasii]